MNMEYARQLLIIVSALMGLFNLFCADFPLKTGDAVKQRCATVACGFFLLALLLK